ncbi:MAG TPA: hypothetical protein VKY92_05840 [Verrucomicrobiae bacterium]|nr:hypothetical protein [Verrucomicrobiae bacterium]
MPLFDTVDGLVLMEEGSSCRARAGALNYLFRNSTEARVTTDYLRTRNFVGSRIGPRWDALKTHTQTPNGLEELVQEITLHWMYHYIVNGLQVAVSDSDIAHPQTRRIIRKHVDRIFGELTERAMLAGGVLFDVSADDFKKGIEGDDRFSEMW